MQRRDLFLQLSRAAAALAWQQVFAPVAQAQGAELGAWTESADVFTLGVASGEPRPDAVVLWTRLAPKPLQAEGGMPDRAVPVRWEVASDDRFAHVLRTGAAVAHPTAGHSVHVDVDGLLPGRTYYYRFEAGGQRSPVGRTRTAPDADASPARLRMALASCQHYEQGFFTAHREMAASDIDLVLFVGDYIYTSEAPGYARIRQHPHVMSGDLSARTLGDYRIHHASYKLDADLRANHAAHPWLLVWDDHEVASDYTGSVSPDLTDAQAFLKVRAAAYQAYFEHMPVSAHRAPVGASMPMQGHFEWGQLAELWTVDTRQFRDAVHCAGIHGPMGGKLQWHCAAAQAPERTVLGQSQEYSLADGLASSSRDWKFIVQSTQVAPGVVKTPFGALVYADGWDAFPAARERLMAAIAQPRVPDVVCLGGDVHRHVAAPLRLDPRDPTSAIVASEIVTSSVSSKGLSELLNAWMKRSNPDLWHLRSDERGYVLLDVTPKQVAVDFRGTPHPVRTDSRFKTQARYVIDRGTPGPRKV
jgi:alkaline phosphatase D